ncbi:MAG: exonuclease domain-containing protein, partial [Burkholderiales bacterium]
MRQIVLDTETTGLDPGLGHRVIELAAVLVVNRRITERTFHCYVNPEREIEAGAMQVHGISNEFLADKPKFGDIASDFIEFVEGSELIIHN